MSETDVLKMRAAAALGEIEVPATQDVLAAAEAVKEAAKKAKKREDATFVTATRGNYEPKTVDLDWIVPYFEKFHERSVDQPESMADALGQVRERLMHSSETSVATLKPVMDGWDGDARDALHDNFVEPLPEAIKNQAEVVDELRAAMWAYEAVLGTARIDAIHVARKTTAMLETLDDLKVKDAPLQLSVVGSAASLVAAIGARGVLGMALVSGAMANRNPVSARQGIDGHDVSAVLDSMKYALDQLEKAMDEEETGIGAEMSKSNDRIDEILGARPGASPTQLLPADTGSVSEKTIAPKNDA